MRKVSASSNRGRAINAGQWRKTKSCGQLRAIGGIEATQNYRERGWHIGQRNKKAKKEDAQAQASQAVGPHSTPAQKG
jgi:hypothetical protein